MKQSKLDQWLTTDPREERKWSEPTVKCQLINDDCIDAMKEMEDNSVDSIVTDPPYELGFMGKSWDASGIAFNIEVWQQALRVLKPGGHLIAFSGSRTYHRMAVAIEDAGFQIRDQIMWVYGSGFPKSLNIEKAINKMDGVEFTEKPASGVGFMNAEGAGGYNTTINQLEQVGESSERATTWQGWGTALKPAHEPMVLARKPVEGTVANNVLTYGVGGLNIDATRVGTTDQIPSTTNNNIRSNSYASETGDRERDTTYTPSIEGRFPANFIHDGLEKEWAKFFYCAKTSKRDRNEGLDGFEGKEIAGKGNGLARTCATCGSSVLDGCNCVDRTYINPTRINHHPTVKPTSLMQYLVRLVTPEGGVVLDPFMGSGSTGKACAYEGFDFIGIDQSVEYVEIARARIAFARADDE
jgi:site-specific DNA-methyltransferase (adenine-specific)